MCGRFTLASDAEALKQTFFDFAGPMNLSRRYNISPTQDVAVIANTPTDTAEHPETGQVEFFHWGLIPSWAKDPKIGNQMINARSETLSEKPSFRNAYKRRRCLILADGYYEWSKIPGTGSNNRCTFVSNRRSRLRSQGYGRYGRQTEWMNRSAPVLLLHARPTPYWRKFIIECL